MTFPFPMVSPRTAAATVPSFSNVIFLSGFEGADASTSITDESALAHTMTAVGNAQIDTAQFKYGTSSLLLDGTGDTVTAADSADWDFSTGDFTIEGWWRFTRNTVTEVMISHYKASAGNRNWIFQYEGANTPDRLRFLCAQNVTDVISSTWTPTTGTWYHLCVDRNGNIFRIYADGVMLAKVTDTPTITGATTTFNLGCSKTSADAITQEFSGWMDEVRVTKGQSVYGAIYGDSSFTPPTAAFPRS